MLLPDPLFWAEGLTFPYRDCGCIMLEGYLIFQPCSAVVPLYAAGGVYCVAVSSTICPYPTLLATIRTLGLCSSLLLIWGSLLASEWVLQEPLYCMDVSIPAWGPHPRVTGSCVPFGGWGVGCPLFALS